MRKKRPGTYAPLATHYYDDPKIIEAGEDAELLYVRMLSFAAGHPEQEGFVPDPIARKRLALSGTFVGTGKRPETVLEVDPETVLEHLAKVGLIAREDDGWRILSWLKWNRSADEIERDRANDRRRKKPVTSGNAKTGTGTGTGKRPETVLEVDPDSGTSSSTQMNRCTDNPLTSFGGAGGGDSEEPHLPDVVADAPTTPAKTDPKRKTTGTRLPDGWFPSRTPGNENAEAGHDQAWLQRELDRFRDYWAAQPGQRGRKADWDATWRNWVRKADEMSPSDSGHLSRRQQETDAQYARAKQRAASGVNPLLELIKDAS